MDGWKNEWMDGKMFQSLVCFMLEVKQMLRLKKKTLLKYYVIKQINICLSAAGCFVHTELFNVGMWETGNAAGFTLVNVSSGAFGISIVFP